MPTDCYWHWHNGWLRSCPLAVLIQDQTQLGPAQHLYTSHRAWLDVNCLIAPCCALLWKHLHSLSFSSHLFRFVTCLYVQHVKQKVLLKWPELVILSNCNYYVLSWLCSSVRHTESSRLQELMKFEHMDADRDRECVCQLCTWSSLNTVRLWLLIRLEISCAAWLFFFFFFFEQAHIISIFSKHETSAELNSRTLAVQLQFCLSARSLYINNIPFLFLL